MILAMNIRAILLLTLVLSGCSASIFGSSTLIKGLGKRVSFGYLIRLLTSWNNEYTVILLWFFLGFFCTQFSLIFISITFKKFKNFSSQNLFEKYFINIWKTETLRSLMKMPSCQFLMIWSLQTY